MPICPKPVSDWNTADLAALNVDKVQLSVEQFFGCRVEDLPAPNFLYPGFAETLEAGVPPIPDGPPAADLHVRNFHDLLERIRRSNRKVDVDLVTYTLLQNLAYQKLSPEVITSITLGRQLNLMIYNKLTTASIDFTIQDNELNLLCLFVDSRGVVHWQGENAALIWPHAQVVAKAVAVATKNLASPSCPDKFRDMVIPALSIIGSWPCFYLIPITYAFTKAVAHGEEPPHPTKFFFCPAPLKHPYYGMYLKPQRILILKMFEAFKKFIPTNFAQLSRFSGMPGDFIPRPLSSDCQMNAWDWVYRFLWECEEHYRRQGINKDLYIHGIDDYFVRTQAPPPTLVPTENVVNSTSAPPPIPQGYPADFLPADFVI